MAFSLDIKSTLGKFGYEKVAEDIVDQLLEVAIDQAEFTAKATVSVGEAPEDPHPGLLRDLIHAWIDRKERAGYVAVSSPYAFAVHFGDKRHFPNPFMSKAARAARSKMLSVMRAAVKKSIAKEKA